MSNSDESSADAPVTAERLGNDARDGGGMLGNDARDGGGMLVPRCDCGGMLGGAAPVVMIAIIFSA
jgi:hypothetical protein